MRCGLNAALAPKICAAFGLQFALRLAALEHLTIERLSARHLHFEPLGERVGDRDADAMQPARGLVDLGIEFAAGVQCAHDDFERGLLGKFRMRVDRDAAAVIGHADEAVGLHLDLDEGRMAGQGLVHGVVDHLGEQMMQRLLIGPADIHAGPAAHRLEPFEHLDVARGIAGLGSAAARLALAAAARRRVGQAGEQVASFWLCGFAHARINDPNRSADYAMTGLKPPCEDAGRMKFFGCHRPNAGAPAAAAFGR
jgi:hypothetical protein